MNRYNQREQPMYLRSVLVVWHLKVHEMNYPPRLRNKIASKPLASAKTPQRFNFSYQIKNAAAVVNRIIPTFING